MIHVTASHARACTHTHPHTNTVKHKFTPHYTTTVFPQLLCYTALPVLLNVWQYPH